MLIEQLAAVAVTVPTFSQIAVQLIGEPTTGVGVQLTVLTMSDPLGCATIATVSVPLLLPNAPDGSFVALVVEFTVTVPATVAVKMTLQPKLLPATTSTGTVAFGHTTVAPAGKLAAFVTLHVAPSAVTVPTLVQVTARTVAPTVAGSGVQTTVLAMSAASATVTVLVQRAGWRDAGGSPLVTLAVLLTLPVVVLVAFRGDDSLVVGQRRHATSLGTGDGRGAGCRNWRAGPATTIGQPSDADPGRNCVDDTGIRGGSHRTGIADHNAAGEAGPRRPVATLAVLLTTRLGWLASVTVTVLVQRAGSGATQPGHPRSRLQCWRHCQ